MSQSILILGRQPALGIAEAESLFGADKITRLSKESIVIDVPATEIPFTRMGGSTRLAKLLTYLPYTDWNKIEEYLAAELPQHTALLPDGKVKLGLSAYSLEVNVRRLNATGLTLKKSVKNSGRSVRVVPNKELELNSAQVLHNQLTGPLGIELLVIRDKDRVALAQTVQVQDIDAYAARDQARPARDAKVGMLPPKLAQIIINLSHPPEEGLVLDPFCGTGVVLQEALLMGYSAHGADLDQRMVDYTSKNLSWLRVNYPQIENLTRGFEKADATTATWHTSRFTFGENGDATDAKLVPLPFTTIACETYLGRPFSSDPKPEVLTEVMQDVDTIHRKFLENVARQTKAGFRMAIAVPAWKTKNGFKHLRTLDNLDNLGYNRLRFVHADTRDLIYHRENQVVGRELVTLIRK